MPCMSLTLLCIYSNRTLYSTLNTRLPQQDLLSLAVLGQKETLSLPAYVVQADDVRTGTVTAEAT